MKQETIVRHNLMTVDGYTPYCGSNNCNLHSPRSVWDKTKQQFTCKCGWVSKFPQDFIDSYIKKWEKLTKKIEVKMVSGKIIFVDEMNQQVFTKLQENGDIVDLINGIWPVYYGMSKEEIDKEHARISFVKHALSFEIFRPKTRGELREALRHYIKCEVVASNEEITTIMLNSLNIMKTDNCIVNFKTYPSINEGWVIYEKID